jgi:hypothetical protein
MAAVALVSCLDPTVSAGSPAPHFSATLYPFISLEEDKTLIFTTAIKKGEFEVKG